MKMQKLLWVMLLAFAPYFVSAQAYKWVEKKSADGKYTYRTVEGDPMQARYYTLSNGLTVILSENKAAPRIQTFIATKAGSKNDPSDNTGLAHYLEHLLFKGTDKYGTLDFAKEKVYLDKIDALYEEYNKTTDEAKRKKIYNAIDSVSGLAAKYAIANEYDKMVQSIGAKGTNAFTSVEQTVYVNDIPTNQMEKWLQIEAERFRNPVLRLFHTELEAVYEEKNISLDNDNRKVHEKLLEGLFTKHAYGTQTTIGTVDHLKNPSLKKIRNYYNTYYVPNNMAIILAGDFDADKTIALIDKNFSYMKSKPVPAYNFQPEPKNNAPKVYTVSGPDAENLMLGFRMPGANSKEANLLYLTDMILSNSKAGLIDLNLVKQQKVLGAGCSPDIMKDYSYHYFMGRPKQGQTLEEVKDMLLAQIEKVKKGEFDESILKFILANEKVRKIQEAEENGNRAYTLLDAFVLGSDWRNRVAETDELKAITKKDIIDFANKYYTNDYVVVYKKTGEAGDVKKVDKPHITPVEVNRQATSAFVKNIVESPAPALKPLFLDYSKDIISTQTASKVPVYYLQNKENGLFTLYYILEMGKNNDLKLPMAVNLLPYLGTDKYTAEQISQEFYKLASSFSVNTSDEQTYISLTGLEENFDASVQLLEHLLANAKPDQAALDQLVERTLKGRANSKLNKGLILRAAMNNYAIYGKDNPFTYNLSNEQLKSLKADELVKYIKDLTSYEHKVYYYGARSQDALTASLNNLHKTPATFIPAPKAKEFVRQDTKENKVLFTDYNMVQAEIMWLNKSGSFNPEKQPVVSLFNEYFGGGMSSLVFQTIRESKALAYSSYSRYTTPSKKQDPYYIMAYIGTQADKLNEAVPAMNELLNNMPKAEKSFDAARLSLRNQIETERITKSNILFSYANAQKLGLDYDIRKTVYEGLDKMTFDDVNKFYSETYKNKPYTYLVLGSKDKIKKDDLAKFGKVQELSLEEIFGY